MKNQPLALRVLIASLTAMVALTALVAAPAAAAEVRYLPGMRVGLAPIPGLAPARAFTGYESMNDAVKVLMTELPAAAYAEVEATLKDNPAGKGPVKPEPLQTAAGLAYYTLESAQVGADGVKRYSMILPGKGFAGYVAVQVADSAADKFPAEAVKAMLASASVRPDVPIEEKLDTMPFRMSELSGFRNVKVLAPGAAILLSEATEDAPLEKAPYMIVGTIAGVPDKPDERARFAQQAAAEIPGLRDGKLTMSEPVRIEGAPGFETRVDAVSGKDSTPVTVVQWLRFGNGGGAIRIVASTPREQWADAFRRFRAVRDGLDPK